MYLSFLQGSKSPSPTRASSKSPKRAGSGKMSDSRPQSAKSKSPSPSRKSSAKSRSSSGKRGSSSHERKKSKSPSPSRKGTTSASSRGRSAGKKKVRVKSPSRTQSGLKIRDLSDQGLTAVPPNLLVGKLKFFKIVFYINYKLRILWTIQKILGKFRFDFHKMSWEVVR